MQGPLNGRRDQAKDAPGEQVAGQEDEGRGIGLFLEFLVPVHRGKHDHHRGGGRRHHGDHHGEPHDEEHEQVPGRPDAHTAERRHPHVDEVHVFHRPGHVEHVCPADGRHEEQPAGNDLPVFGRGVRCFHCFR